MARLTEEQLKIMQDRLIRRGINPNVARQKVLDIAKMGDNFTMVGNGNITTPYRPNFISGSGSSLKYIGNQPVRNAIIPANTNTNLDVIYPKGKVKDIAEEVGETTNKRKGVIGNTFKQYAPFISDYYDMQSGIKNIKSGHPIVGGGQVALGLAGLGADVGGVLAAPFTGGGSFVGEQVAKNAAKAAIKAGAKGLIKTAAGIQSKKLTGPTARFLYSQGLNLFKDNNGNIIEQPIQEGALAGNNQQAKQPVINNQTKQQYPYTAPFDSIEELILNRAGGYNNLEGQDLPDIQSLNTGNVPVDAEGSIAGNIDLNGMLDRYRRQQELQKPYIEGLQNLINNYNNLQRNAFNLDRYFTGLAGWSGNDRWADFGKRYNPITTEATKLDLLNKLAQGQIGIDDIENEMSGNIALAQQAGIDPRVAMANPKLVNALASIENAKTSAAARRYAADASKEAKLTGIYSNAMIQKAKQEGNWDLALRLQEMRNDGRLQSAIVNAVSFGADPSVIYNALQGYGGGNIQSNNLQPPREIITTPTGSVEANRASGLLDNIKR